MPASTLLTVVLLLAGGALGPQPGSTPTPEPAGETGRVVTPLDYFANGRRAVDEFIAGGTPDALASGRLTSVIENGKRLCARIELRTGAQQSSYDSVMASGVVIDGGKRVVTAGHSFQGRSAAEIFVTFASGEVHRAVLQAQRYDVRGDDVEDWAILEVLDPPRTALPDVGIAAVRLDGLAIVLGYPDHIGVDVDGRVVFGSQREGQYLEPLVTLADVQTTAPLMLKPRAGSIPSGGMSGGPVFDREGNLVGVFVSILRGESRDSYSYRIAPLSDLRDRLVAAR